MPAAIKVENLSKIYELGEVGTGSLANDLSRLWARLRGKDDPFLKVGEVNDRTRSDGGKYVLSLKDINFEIEKGDAVGIIGRNGAGKSTLLKILSRVTAPTQGRVKMKGRVGSLLEVGTGFHPELTGRENIFLNGAILGMRKEEIKRKFDEIVDFSGVARYIDTPVKKYSSGMYVRLAFAVAAYLESEILIVDEVLAVGDAEFQKKCLGKIGEVSEGEGRTVLFVSHNMASVQSLCNKCLLLQNGELKAFGDKNTVIEEYLSQGTHLYYENDAEAAEPIVHRAYFEAESILHSETAVLHIEIRSKIYCKSSVDVRIASNFGVPVGYGSIGALSYGEQLSIEPGIADYKIGIDLSRLALGNYTISIDLTEPDIKYYDRCENCLHLEVLKADEHDRRMSQHWGYGSMKLPLKIL